MFRILPLCLLFVFYCGSCHADKIVWTGQVNSNGKPSELITLDLHDKYQIQISGIMNLGKWIQQAEQLANDACYEFKTERALSRIESIKNSLNISVCDGTYHSNHIYRSKPFIAEQNRIHFWVNDSNYDDNSGAFEVQITKIAK